MRQYQLAIVEDEPHTARYIQGIVEATNLFHIAAVCESAEELLTLEPFPDLDVLVTDVKMSGLTGLELLRELQTRLPQLCSIIISGYDSFEYARDAIRLNVSNYILKPISKDELTVALLHLYDQLSNLRQKSGEEYLNSLYQEGEQPLEQALSLPAPYYHVLMAAGMNDQNQLILRCRTLLALEKHPELQMCIYQYGFLILLGVGQADAPNRLEQSAATIAAWERDSGATALLLLTDRAVAREELKREVRHLFHAHQKNLVLGKSVVMRLSAARTPEANTKEEQALTERLQQSLTAQNAEHFHMALCQLFSSWESRSADIYTIKQLLFALVSRVSQKRENSDDPITLMNRSWTRSTARPAMRRRAARSGPCWSRSCSQSADWKTKARSSRSGCSIRSCSSSITTSIRIILFRRSAIPSASASPMSASFSAPMPGPPTRTM